MFQGTRVLRAVVAAAAVVWLATPLVATAQPAGKAYRIGLLSATAQAPGIAPFRQGLRDLGYVEGQSLVIDLRSAEGRYERLPALAAELVELRVDVIVAMVTHASLAARNATRPIPEGAARALRIRLTSHGVREAGEIDGAFEAMVRDRSEALIVIFDALLLTHRGRIADLAVKNRLPSVRALSEYAEAGGLIAYGPNWLEPGTRAAAQVDKILKGAKPADLPVEQATKHGLTLNLKTAKAIGLSVPAPLTAQADRVIG
jgi:putative ABC transport system substrate-binding protein